jgi:hypothetical protein
VSCGQLDVDVARGQHRESGGEGEDDADDAEEQAHERGGGKLGREEDVTARLEEQGRADRAVAELARDDDEPGERCEQNGIGRPVVADQGSLHVLAAELLELRAEPFDEDAEEGQRDHGDQERSHGPSRPDLEQFGAELLAHE